MNKKHQGDFMDKVLKFYELIEPIAELIEEKKEKIDLLISAIEDDIDTGCEEWLVIQELEDALLNLSFSGGDTALKDLKELLEGS